MYFFININISVIQINYTIQFELIVLQNILNFATQVKKKLIKSNMNLLYLLLPV